MHDKSWASQSREQYKKAAAAIKLKEKKIKAKEEHHPALN